MAGQDDSAERTEEPTQRKLEEARREGQVLTSKEMLVFAAIAAATVLLLVLPLLGTTILARWQSYLLAPAVLGEEALLQALHRGGRDVLLVMAIVGLPIMVLMIGTQIAIGGLNWTAKGFAFKPDKIDPLKGLKRMVSATALVELGKAVGKVSLLGIVVLGGVYAGLHQLKILGLIPLTDALRLVFRLALGIFAGLTLVLAVIAFVDLVWSAYKHRKQLRMTLSEVKRESREDNGSPEVKVRMRRLQMDPSQRSARERGALDSVPQATAVIVNPTHFAVALRYLPDRDEVPVILATGRDALALQVIARAEQAAIPVLRLPPLARALYFTGDIGQPIHEGLFGAVAAVLAHIWRLERGLQDDLPQIDLPTPMQFDANGHARG
ncbi:MAG: EscU/YscU/HrcU family type III secretion system export apparatus switch protein [Roseinatronobacter sp.]|nr:EscU/YscU/HrcU family type III secretion system export apparatus switch protein [Roseinatronobacter sp.]